MSGTQKMKLILSRWDHPLGINPLTPTAHEDAHPHKTCTLHIPSGALSWSLLQQWAAPQQRRSKSQRVDERTTLCWFPQAFCGGSMPSAHGRSPICVFWITTTHLSSDGLNFAKENGIIMLSLQDRCLHGLQPLNRSVYGRLKSMQILPVISGWGAVKKKCLNFWASHQVTWL